ncbi:carbohydrate binding family 9 domain-containing protein [Bacteroidota bacterium]
MFFTSHLCRKFSIIFFSLLLIFSFYNGFAQEAFDPVKTTIPPKIDGILDEEIWQQSEGLTGFKTFMPDFGKDPEEKTIVYITYDSENVYFGFKCYDKEPEKIKTSVSPRDKIRPDDWICINIDSNNDNQSLCAIYSNPSGIQMDARWDGQKEDHGVDLIFESAGSIDDEGYNIEIKIPFKSLRYSRKDIVQMGVVFERRISRYSSQATYPELDPERGMDFLLTNMKINFQNIKFYTLLEILPAVTYSNIKSAGGGKLNTDFNKGELSLTSKVGISSDLIFDITYNPDFSQVESDAGQVDENQRYDLIYPEKRPFFLEGNDQYGFAGSDEMDPFRSIVHTRKIVDPEIGAKLTGKIGKQNHIAAMYALDKILDLDKDGNQQYANFSILRYKRSFNDDNYLGAFLTDRKIKEGYNRIFGGDGKIRLGKSSTIGFHAVSSFTADSIIESPDPESAIGISYQNSTRNRTFKTSFQNISQGFQTQTGYIQRTGITRGRIMYNPNFFPKKGFIKKIGPMFMGENTYDKPSGLNEFMIGPGVSMLLSRSTNITALYSFSTEIYENEKFITDGAYIRGSSQIFRQLFINFTYRQGKRIRYIENPYQARGNTIDFSANYQPFEHFNTILSYTYYDLYKNSDGKKIFDYNIIRSKNTFQINKYLFIRAIFEYNTYIEELTTDFLASFTYIPGTVVHFGYGSMYEKTRWNGQEYIDGTDLLETRRGFFFKASYLWRL